MLTPNQFAWQSILKNRFCSLIFLCLVGIASACLFGVGFFNENLSSGIGQVKGRIGADLIAVPSSYDKAAKDALFAGDACTILFPENPEAQISQLDGISQVSSQLYLKTLAFSCCSTAGLQLIAFDPKTDFTVSKWTDEKIENLAADEMVVGACCGMKQGTSMNFYGQTFKVADVLDETGMGYDQSIFISYDAANQITASPEYAVYFGEKQNLSSMILINTDSGSDIETLSKSLGRSLNGVSLYATDSLVSELKSQADYFRISGFVMDAFVILLAVIALFALITITFYQRKKRVGSLLSVGISRGKIVQIFFLEYLYLTLLGTGAGIGIVSVFVIPLHQIIKQTVNMPYRLINFGGLALLILAVCGVNLLILLISCSLTFTKILRTEPAHLTEEMA